MRKELQDYVWQNCLPKEFKEEVKENYNKWIDSVTFEMEIIIYEYLFGHHNLTSDAEGEEMLTVSRKQVQAAYKTSKGIVCNEDYGTKMYSMHLQIMCVLENLFGSKCLPDEEPKPDEPKFKVDGYAMLKGRRVQVIKYDERKEYPYVVFVLTENYSTYAKESDLEPCTEPTEDAQKGAKRRRKRAGTRIRGIRPRPLRQAHTAWIPQPQQTAYSGDD